MRTLLDSVFRGVALNNLYKTKLFAVFLLPISFVIFLKNLFDIFFHKQNMVCIIISSFRFMEMVKLIAK